MSEYLQKQVEPQVEVAEDDSHLNEDDDNWQNYDQNFGNIDKLKSMVELGKKLEKFALMVHGKQYVISDLRRELLEMRNVELESVKSLVDLTKTNEVLAAERTLNGAHRNTILIDILTTRKKLAKEIVAEGAKCSLMADYARIVDLFRAWSMISDAKLIKSEAKNELDNIKAALKEAKTICGQTKFLMTKYTANNDDQQKHAIMEQLKVKSKKINEAYKECFAMIQKIHLQIGDKIVKFQYLKYEQEEAEKINTKQALDKIDLGSILNPIKLLVPLFYGTVGAVNCVDSKLIEKTQNNLIEINKKLHELNRLANAIKEASIEAQTFIDSNQ